MNNTGLSYVGLLIHGFFSINIRFPLHIPGFLISIFDPRSWELPFYIRDLGVHGMGVSWNQFHTDTERQLKFWESQKLHADFQLRGRCPQHSPPLAHLKKVLLYLKVDFFIVANQLKFFNFHSEFYFRRFWASCHFQFLSANRKHRWWRAVTWYIKNSNMLEERSWRHFSFQLVGDTLYSVFPPYIQCGPRLCIL